jgi:hypothetical protein
VRLVPNYQLRDGWWCGSTSRIHHASYLETPPMLSPGQGSWHFGNGMTPIGFSPHAQYHERHRYDLTQRDSSNATFRARNTTTRRSSCFGEKVHAMADGSVLG